MNIFTFWEGEMPDYIKLCMSTWQLPYTVLNYSNLHNFTNVDIDFSKKFTLPQIADYVRVHVLRDQGGYWLDTDTIMLTGKLPVSDMVGDPQLRSNTIGLLYSEPNSEMFTEWAKYQDEVMNAVDFRGASYHWSIMGNWFTDKYVEEHPEIRIYPVEKFWPETYMITEPISRYQKYLKFYFEKQYQLQDIKSTDLLMLHNSWTPDWYKELPVKDVLNMNCTLSNILKEVLNGISRY